MSSTLEARIAALPPEKRKLLERRLAREGLGRREGGGGRTIPRRAEGPGPWPLSYGQRRLWFIDRLNPGSSAYNIPFAGRIAGPLRADLLARALREVVRRHQVLRSRFVEDDGRPVQVVDPPDPAGAAWLPVVDLSRLPAAARDAEAVRLTDAEPQRPFDLARGPVVRMTLLRLGAAEGERLHDLLVTMPHIVTDAWSMAVLFRELPAIYDAFRRGRPSPLADPPVQVADFALWERERLDGSGGAGASGEGILERELAFWRAHLEGAPPVLDLPTDRPRPPVQSMRGVRRAVSVPRTTSRRLESFAEGEGATPFMALLASFGAALGRWAGQDDLLLASPLATRGEPEVQGLIGFFIDNAVLRVDLSGDPSFRSLLARVRESALATFAHQGVPFEKVAEAVGAGGDLSRPPLAQVNFVLQNVHIPAPEFDELSLVRAQQTDTRSARFDLALGLFEGDGDRSEGAGAERSLAGWFEYATDLFDETTIARLERHWLDLLAAALARPDAPLSELAARAVGVQVRREAHQTLLEWNDRPVGSSLGDESERWNAGIHELVAGWSARTPDAVALESFERGRARSVTYGELDRRAAALAERLRPVLAAARAAHAEPLVALAIPRSPELVVATLAVWRAGGGYVPLDPGLPAARRELLLADARPVAQIDARLEVRPLGNRVAPPRGERRRPAVGGGERLAYLLYTSGSTGTPKGVPVPHRAVVRLARGGDFRRLGPRSVTLTLPPASFDASVFGLWVPLAGGGRLAFFPDDLPAVHALEEALRRFRVSALVLPTALLHLVAESRPEAFAEVGDLFAGGEAMAPDLAARVLAAAPATALHNSYGPTENGIFTTIQKVARRGAAPGPPAGGSVPIGRPVAATRVAVLDSALRAVPLGAAGELVVAGAGLARGYQGRPGATAERFVPLPEELAAGVPGARIYRTGDRARWLPDGRLDFLGRLDRQVKIRGHRVEPGEVEAALLRHPAVTAAAVVSHEGRLIAYVAGRAEAPPEAEALRAHAATLLPEAMVPAVVVPVAELPLNRHGKLDRSALPDPGPALESSRAARRESGEPARPATRAEEILAAVWRDVLGVESVGLHDRFFDLGGDSILAIRAISRAAEAGLRLEPRQLFEHPTVASLARVAVPVDGAAREPAAPVTGPVPIGPAQRWFLEELAPPVPEHWNLALLLSAPTAAGAPGHPPALALDRLAGALASALDRHDMLRSRIHRGDHGDWRQEVLPTASVPVSGRLGAVDLSGLSSEHASRALRAAKAASQSGLDLAAAGLVRVVRFDLPPGEPESSELLLVVHHLVADAVSLQVLLDDLARPGAAVRPGSSFRDWATALEAWIDGPAAEPERARLRSLAAGSPRVGEPPASREGDAGVVEVELPAAETERLLGRAAEALRAAPEELVVAGAAMALAERDPEREGALRIDVEGHGRGLPEGCAAASALDLSRTVGWFTALRPLALPGAGGRAADPARVLREVKDGLRSFQDGGVGHAALRWLGRELPRPAPAALSVNYLGRIDAEARDGRSGPRLVVRTEAGAAGPLRHPDAPRPYALELTAYVRAGALHAVWTYDRARAGREEIEALAARALSAVQELADEEAASDVLAPSDFPHAGLDEGSLGRLLGKLDGG